MATIDMTRVQAEALSLALIKGMKDPDVFEVTVRRAVRNAGVSIFCRDELGSVVHGYVVSDDGDMRILSRETAL